MKTPSKLKDYRKWFKGHFTEKELKAIVSFEGMNIAGCGPKGYQVRIQKPNGFVISDTTMTKEQLIGMVLV